MARTNIPVQVAPQYGSAIASITWTSADSVNGMSFVNDGQTVLLVKNGDAASKTVTVSGVANSRTFNIAPSKAYSVNANNSAAAGLFQRDAFNQSTGVVHVDFSAATNVTVAAIRLSRTPDA